MRPATAATTISTSEPIVAAAREGMEGIVMIVAMFTDIATMIRPARAAAAPAVATKKSCQSAVMHHSSTRSPGPVTGSGRPILTDGTRQVNPAGRPRCQGLPPQAARESTEVMNNDTPERDNEEIVGEFDQTNGKVSGLEGDSDETETDDDGTFVREAGDLIDDANPLVQHDGSGTSAEDRDEAVTSYSEERDR